MTATQSTGQVIQTPLPISDWRVAHGFIFSWVDTGLPGYRDITIGGTAATVADDYQRFDEYVQGIDAVLPGGWTAQFDSTYGHVTLSGSSSTVSFADRMGWLLGICGEPTTTFTSSTSLVSSFVPPGCIPCLGIVWDEVDIERDREVLYDRSRRQQGYVFGGSRVWRIRATMTRYALEALLTGWCLRGKVTIQTAGDTNTMSSSQPGGELTGYVLGLTNVSWIDADSLQGLASVSMLVTTTTT
jgi:hypothetical protein